MTPKELRAYMPYVSRRTLTDSKKTAALVKEKLH
jgi:hypothetical protein